MQFAWQMKKLDNYVSSKPSLLNRLIVFFYNLVWWAPIALPFFGVVDFRTGSILFIVITTIRAGANSYRVNVLKLESAEIFPFRGP